MPPDRPIRKLESGLWVYDDPPPPPPPPPSPPDPPPTVCRGGCGKPAPDPEPIFGCVPRGWHCPWYCCGHERPVLCADCRDKLPGCSVCGCQEEYC